MANDRYESEVKMELLEKQIAELKKDIIGLVVVQEQQANQIRLLELSYNNLAQQLYQNRKEA
jgi:hypothetical protein